MVPSKIRKGFSLVELMIVIVIIGILSGAAYYGIQRAKVKNMNDKVLDDLIAISNSLEQYKMDHFGMYPIPKTTAEDPVSTMNVLCYDAAATYAHDCATASFRQGMIDNNLLSKRYLQEVPTDPRTGSRYVYGVSNDGKYFMVAGLYEEDDGNFTARTTDNLAKGFALPSLVRAFDGPNFVMDKGLYLPYSPDHMTISAKLDNINGMVIVCPQAPADDCESGISANDYGQALVSGDIVATKEGQADIYFSDGSVSHLDSNSTLKIKAAEVRENNANSIITKIKLFLSKGRIWSKVARLAEKSEFSIETTTAIAGVRGTEFGIDTNGAMVVRSGSVYLCNTATECPKTTPQPDITGTPTALTYYDLKYKQPLTDTALANPLVHLMEGQYQTMTLNNNIRPYVVSVIGDATSVEVEIKYVAGLDYNFLRVYDINRLGTDGAPSQINEFESLSLPPDSQQGTFKVQLPADNKSVVFRYEKVEQEKVYTSAFSDPPITLTPGINLTEEVLHPKVVEEGGPKLEVMAPPVFQLSEAGASSPPNTFDVTAHLLGFDATTLGQGGQTLSFEAKVDTPSGETAICSTSAPTVSATDNLTAVSTVAVSSSVTTEKNCILTISAKIAGSAAATVLAENSVTVKIIPAGALMVDFSFVGVSDTPYVLPPPPNTKTVPLYAISPGAIKYEWGTSLGSVTQTNGSGNPTAVLNLGEITGNATYTVSLMVTDDKGNVKKAEKPLSVRLPVIADVRITPPLSSQYKIGDIITPYVSVTMPVPDNSYMPSASLLGSICNWSATSTGTGKVSIVNGVITATNATTGSEQVTLACTFKPLLPGYQISASATAPSATFAIIQPYTFFADFLQSGSQPTPSCNAAYPVNLAPTEIQGASCNASGLQLTSGDGNRLAYPASGNFNPNKGSMEIVVDNSNGALNENRAIYLFDAKAGTDDAKNRIVVYFETPVGSNRKMWIKVYDNNGLLLGYKTNDINLSPLIADVKIIAEWDVTAKNALVQLQSPATSPTYTSTGPLSNPKTITGTVNNVATFYLGSQVGGAPIFFDGYTTKENCEIANKTWNLTLNKCVQYTQYPNFIKSIKIAQ